MIVCGEGELIRTFLEAGKPQWAKNKVIGPMTFASKSTLVGRHDHLRFSSM